MSVSGDAILNGNSSTDADNDPLAFKWEQLAGPATATIVSQATAVTNVTGLKQGEYYFKLTVDDGKDVDFDIVKVVSDPNTKLAEVSDKEIIIYPNPVYESFYIQNSGDRVIDAVRVFDLNGKLIKTITVNSNKVSMTGVSQGNYCISLVSKGKICKVVQIIKK
jgi:hypothetical protein